MFPSSVVVAVVVVVGDLLRPEQWKVTVFPVLSADAISSGDDEDDAERSDDVGADGEQMSEYSRIRATVHGLWSAFLKA